MPCRINRRREWTHRIHLESLLHGQNAFLTLTYEDGTLPLTSSGLPTLDPKHLQLWLKKFRKVIHPSKVRYYAIGEYGDVTQRPHYHVALFGYPHCSYGTSRYSKSRQNCCAHCDLVRDTWEHGSIYSGEINTSSAQYIAGYVTKKLTQKDNPALLGRYPEFGRMSLKPGIGADFMHEVASTLLALAPRDDVPTSLQHGARQLPLGRYLRRRLRKLTGHDESAPETTIQKLQDELQPLRQAAFDNSRSFKKEVINDANQKVLNQETRAKIFKQRKIL